MRVLICGDRHWTRVEAIRRELSRFGDDVEVIHGCAPGADSLADQVALERQLAVHRYPANWDKYGTGAGPRRNRQMLKEGRPDLVLAFHPDITTSRGTRHMVRIAEEAGVPVQIFKE